MQKELVALKIKVNVTNNNLYYSNGNKYYY